MRSVGYSVVPKTFNFPDHLGEPHKPLVVRRPQSECCSVRLLVKEKEIKHRKLLKWHCVWVMAPHLVILIQSTCLVPLDESSPPSVSSLCFLVINIIFSYFRNERNANALSEKQWSDRNKKVMRGVWLNTALTYFDMQGILSVSTEACLNEICQRILFHILSFQSAP